MKTATKDISIESISLLETNPRKNINKEALQELADSIEKNGLLQPILVKENGNDKKPGYTLIYGERRFKASKLAGQKTIRAEIREIADDKILEMQVLENLQREDISPLDEARAFKLLMQADGIDLFASKVNKSKKYVLDRIKLLDLCEIATAHLETGVLPLGHAMLLSKIDIDKQEKVIKTSDLFLEKRISEDVTDLYCTKTVHQLKASIAAMMLSFYRANFDLDDAELIPNAGSCQLCPKRTINQNLLFGDITEDDLCTDGFCFDAKIKRQLEVNLEKANQEFGNVQVGEKDQWSSHNVIVDKESRHFADKKTEKHTIPVVINKTANLDGKNLGRTVWIEDKNNEAPPEPIKEVTNNWEANREKEFNEIIIPRYKDVLYKAVVNPHGSNKVVTRYIIDCLYKLSLTSLLIIEHFLQSQTAETAETLTYSELKAITADLTNEENKAMCFKIAVDLEEHYTLTTVLLILAIDDLIEDDFENSFVEHQERDFDLTIKTAFQMLGLPIEVATEN